MFTTQTYVFMLAVIVAIIAGYKIGRVASAVETLRLTIDKNFIQSITAILVINGLRIEGVKVVPFSYGDEHVRLARELLEKTGALPANDLTE